MAEEGGSGGWSTIESDEVGTIIHLVRLAPTTVNCELWHEEDGADNWCCL